MKNKLIEQKKRISLHRVTWQGKLDKLKRELESASDRIYMEKRKGRISIQDQIDVATKKTNMKCKIILINLGGIYSTVN